MVLFSGGNDSRRLLELLDAEPVLLTVLSPPAQMELDLIKELGNGYKHYIADYPIETITAYGKKTCIACKAYMYLCAERLARQIGANAIATGEIAGSKASQTVDNLLFYSRIVNIPVMRPLYGLEKKTYDRVAGAKCDILPRRPATRVRNLDLGPLKKACKAAKIKPIK